MTTSARFTHIFRSFRHTSATQQAMWSSAAGMPKAEKRISVEVVLFAVAYSTLAHPADFLRNFQLGQLNLSQQFPLHVITPSK